MEATRKELMQGVGFTYLPARKFKTSVLSAQFVTPMSAEHVCANALIPSVLRRGTVSCPTQGDLSDRLYELYGASIDYTVRKKDENQCVGFVASFIDDSFVPGGEKLLEPVADLLGELICDPATERGRFLSSYVESEKQNLVDSIRGIVNEKRSYANMRLLQEMCAGETYGIPSIGTEEGVEKLHHQKLYAQYGELISTAQLELFYIGSAPLQRVEQALLHAFSTLPREEIREISLAAKHPARSEVLNVTESMDVTQGKLGMGFSCGSEDHMALLMGNAIFGGTSNAKLFLNVREKLSLCYFASSSYQRRKGLITVSSGIEFQNYQRAYDEIMAQLKAVQTGEIEDWELEAARASLLNSIAAMEDSQGRLENYYLTQASAGQEETPDLLAKGIQSVTKDRIVDAARTVALDTVYFLTGKEDAE